MKKKLFFVLLVVLVAASPIFASDTDTMTIGTSVNITSIPKIIAIVTGVVPGGFIAIKFIIDILTAYAHREQDPTKIQKAIVGLVIVVLILLGYSLVINYVFSEDATEDSQKSFLSGLTGAEAAELPAGSRAMAVYAPAV